MQIIVNIHGHPAVRRVGRPLRKPFSVGIAVLDEVGPVVRQLVGKLPAPAGVGLFALSNLIFTSSKIRPALGGPALLIADIPIMVGDARASGHTGLLRIPENA